MNSLSRFGVLVYLNHTNVYNAKIWELGCHTAVLIPEAGTKIALSDAATANKYPTKIFVPDSQLSAYKTATNWNTIADHIYPISSYTNFID